MSKFDTNMTKRKQAIHSSRCYKKSLTKINPPQPAAIVTDSQCKAFESTCKFSASSAPFWHQKNIGRQLIKLFLQCCGSLSQNTVFILCKLALARYLHLTIYRLSDFFMPDWHHSPLVDGMVVNTAVSQVALKVAESTSEHSPGG